MLKHYQQADGTPNFYGKIHKNFAVPGVQPHAQKIDNTENRTVTEKEVSNVLSVKAQSKL